MKTKTRLLLVGIVLIALLVTVSSASARVCLGDFSCSEMLNDGFEGTPWKAHWATTPNGWFESTLIKHNGSVSAGSRDGREGYFVCKPLDARGASSITVEFWYGLHNTEPADLKLYYYNGSQYNLIAYLGGGPEDTWRRYTEEILDTRYFNSDFRIGFVSTLGSNEKVWVDDVVITTCKCVPITYSWWTSDWSACSASCGGGTQTRKVECRDDTGQAVDDTFCGDSATKPASEQECNTQPCTSPSPSTSPGPTPIPEFSTIALPVASILGLMFFFSYSSKRRKQ